MKFARHLFWIGLCACPSLQAANVPLHVGKPFATQLNAPASILWSGVPLRQAMGELAAARGLAVWVDRRCDPSMPLTFQGNEPRLRDCLQRVSRELGSLDVAWINGVLLVGPPGVPDRVATVHRVHLQMLERLPAAKRRRWLREKAWSWPRLTNPQRLLSELETELQIELPGREAVVHDLWPEMQLPPLSAAARLGLLLSGFGHTFVLDAQGNAKVVRLPQQPKYRAVVPHRGTVQAERLLAMDPHARLDRTKNPPELLARWGTHQALESALQAGGQKSPASMRYSLRVEQQPFGAVTRSLAKQFGIEVQFADAVAPLLEQRVSFEVREATDKELVQSLMRAAGAEYQLEASTLRVLGTVTP